MWKKLSGQSNIYIKKHSLVWVTVQYQDSKTELKERNFFSTKDNILKKKLDIGQGLTQV